MGKVGEKEILTQKHVIQFFKNELASADFVDIVLLEARRYWEYWDNSLWE